MEMHDSYCNVRHIQLNKPLLLNFIFTVFDPFSSQLFPDALEVVIIRITKSTHSKYNNI